MDSPQPSTTNDPLTPESTSILQPRTWPLYRVGSAIALIAIAVLSFVLKSPTLLLALSPIVFGSILALISSESFTARIDRWEHSFEGRGQRAATKDTKFARFFLRPLWAGSGAIWKKTEGVSQRHFRAGLRLALLVYYFGLMLAALAVVGYAAFVVIVVIAVLVFMFWLLMKYLTRNDPPEDEVHIDYPVQMTPQIAESRRVEGLTGPRTEYYDKQGRKIGEARERDGLLGKYTEQYRAGRKTGESRERDGLLGHYTEHTDREGRTVAESRERDGLLGPYTEHRDVGGKKIGESREREGLLGEYTEHSLPGRYCTGCGTLMPGGSKFCTKCGMALR